MNTDLICFLPYALRFWLILRKATVEDDHNADDIVMAARKAGFNAILLSV